MSSFGRRASRVAQWERIRPPAQEKQETRVPPLGREDPLDGEWPPLQYLAWGIPRTEEPGRLPSTGSHRVTHDWTGEVQTESGHERKTPSRRGHLSKTGRAGLGFYLHKVANPLACLPTVDSSQTVLPWAETPNHRGKNHSNVHFPYVAGKPVSPKCGQLTFRQRWGPPAVSTQWLASGSKSVVINNVWLCTPT